MPVSEAELRAYIEELFADWGSSSDTCAGRLALRVRSSIKYGLHRLNAVPESDAFWDRGNRRPTLFKLDEYSCERMVASEDERDLWVFAALDLYYGSNDFGREYLGKLVLRDIRNIIWLTIGAAELSGSSGIDTEPALREELRKLESATPDFRDELEALRRDRDDCVAQAARRALELL